MATVSRFSSRKIQKALSDYYKMPPEEVMHALITFVHDIVPSEPEMHIKPYKELLDGSIGISRLSKDIVERLMYSIEFGPLARKWKKVIEATRDGLYFLEGTEYDQSNRSLVPTPSDNENLLIAKDRSLDVGTRLRALKKLALKLQMAQKASDYRLSGGESTLGFDNETITIGSQKLTFKDCVSAIIRDVPSSPQSNHHCVKPVTVKSCLSISSRYRNNSRIFKKKANTNHNRNSLVEEMNSHLQANQLKWAQRMKVLAM